MLHYAKISDDGKSLMVRIPAKMKKELKLEKGKYMLFDVKKEITVSIQDIPRDCVYALRTEEYKRRIISFLKTHPGMHSRYSIKIGTGLTWKTVNKQLDTFYDSERRSAEDYIYFKEVKSKNLYYNQNYRVAYMNRLEG